METPNKSPLKKSQPANYCRLPVKSRAEKLFDKFCPRSTASTFADLSNNIDSFTRDSVIRPKKKLQFATYSGGNLQKRQGRKKTCKKEAITSIKEAVLNAFLNAGLPDYEAIAALPLNVVVMDPNQKPEKQTDSISSENRVKPFIPLLKKIDASKNNSSDFKDQNPAINIESPSFIENHLDDLGVDSEAETLPDDSGGEPSPKKSKEASTPIPNTRMTSPPQLDLSCIPSSSFKEPSDPVSTPNTPHGPQPIKKKPWNVADRRGTTVLPPHPVVFDEPNIISNDSIDVSDDEPLEWSKVHSLAEMDESVHSVFSVNFSAKLQNELRNSIASTKANKTPMPSAADNPSNYCRRSIFETAQLLHSMGKSCRTIIREPTTGRRSTRKRKSTIPDQALSFLAAFDKTYVEDESHHIPLTSKEKVLSLCKPPKITTFNNVLDKALRDSVVKIGEGSYGEVFKSRTADDKEVVIKVVPTVSGPNTVVEDEKWTQILPELVISLTFGDLRIGSRNMAPNFINTYRASCVSGTWPKELVDAWNEYHQNKTSENKHPDNYEPNTNWLIILLNNGGVELENYPLTSAAQVLSIILQTALSLAAAEEEFEFEHRDLHTGNILVMPYDDCHLDYKLDGKNIKLPSLNLKVSVIDFTLARMAKGGYIVYDDLSKYEDIFTGEGDYQFEIYRLMREANGNDWKSFTPYTNILWLHYLTTKLLDDKKFKSRSKAHQAAMKAVKGLKASLLDYNSTKKFVQSPLFTTLLGKLG